MTKNIGTFDRVGRLVIGVVLIAVAFIWVTTLWIQVILVILALFSLYEAFASWCLFYQLIGRNTCPVE